MPDRCRSSMAIQRRRPGCRFTWWSARGGAVPRTSSGRGSVRSGVGAFLLRASPSGTALRQAKCPTLGSDQHARILVRALQTRGAACRRKSQARFGHQRTRLDLFEILLLALRTDKTTVCCYAPREARRLPHWISATWPQAQGKAERRPRRVLTRHTHRLSTVTGCTRSS